MTTASKRLKPKEGLSPVAFVPFSSIDNQRILCDETQAFYAMPIASLFRVEGYRVTRVVD
jgi:hypothetical protein